MDNTEYVNVFQGCGKSLTPKKKTLSSKWNMFKGKAGNTSPAVCLPFGAVSCVPYSGGYSSGYGNLKLNCGNPPKSFFKGKKIIGFSHFGHSGTGAIGLYYNYLLTVPFLHNERNIYRLKDIDSEVAVPGYYSCKILKDNILCETTVGDKYSIHHYSNEGEYVNCYIDVTNDGLCQKDKRVFGFATKCHVQVYGSGEVGGYSVFQGVKLYYYVKCSDNNAKAVIAYNKKEIQSKVFDIENPNKKCAIKLITQKKDIYLTVSFSLVSEEVAKQGAINAKNFEDTKSLADKSWRDALGKIQLEGVNSEDREIFYSNFYHSIIKPCGWKKESFLWKEDEVFYTDFATMWDLYKTQLPLVFTLYKDIGKGIVETILRFGKEKGKLFNALLLSENFSVESQQACCLCCFSLYDAYRFGLIEESRVDDMFLVVKNELQYYFRDIESLNLTKKQDLFLAIQAFAELAQKLKKRDYSDFFKSMKIAYEETFDDTGLMKPNNDYYEGNQWNYSFRFVRNVQQRLQLGGGKENVERCLDLFFAINDKGKKKNRFEGYNNETDMETPYFYHYVDRREKLETIINECIDNCFKAGREGLPGNNDSGGLSTCYMWNYLGIFPISGQGYFFLGIPRAEKAILNLNNSRRLVITKTGSGNHVNKITLNGCEINDYKISVENILSGGELLFYTK